MTCQSQQYKKNLDISFQIISEKENENINEKALAPEPVTLNHILTKDSMAPNVR